MTYLDDLAQEIQRETPAELLPTDDTMPLFRLYAVLVLAKGVDVSPADVHNAWSAWMADRQPHHRSLRPFDELDASVQEADEPFVTAIRRVARRFADSRHHLGAANVSREESRTVEWSEAKPVLEATYRLLAQSEGISGQEVNQALERAPDDEATGRVLEKLHEAGYIKGHFVMQTSLPVMIESTEKGLQETSGWPAPGGAAGTEQIELLLRLLDERIEDETTPEEERGTLRRVRVAVGDVGRGVLTEVLAAYIARVSGADR